MSTAPTGIINDLVASLQEMIDAYGSDDGGGPISIIERAKVAIARAKPIITDFERIGKYRTALNHWLAVGYTYEIARALAAVLHGENNDVKVWAKGIMETKTNRRLEDMI